MGTTWKQTFWRQTFWGQRLFWAFVSMVMGGEAVLGMDLEAKILPVPQEAIPVGHAGDRSDVLAITPNQMPWITQPTLATTLQDEARLFATLEGTASLPPTPSTRTQAIATPTTGDIYQVFVEPANAQAEAYVQRLVPGAWPGAIGGRRVLLLGRFRDRPSADQLMRQLVNLGVWPQLERRSP